LTRLRQLGLSLIAIILIACGSNGSAKPASDSGDLVAAQVQGAWDLSVSVNGYTGPAATHFLAVGHKAVDRVWFQPQCAGTGHCSLQIWGPTGPDAQQAAYYTYHGPTSGLQAPPVSVPLQQSGDTYAATVPIGGYGGQIPCRPPAGEAAPTQQLTLRVSKARRTASGWLATELVGSESFDAIWGCSGGTFTGWVVGHLGIAGKPIDAANQPAAGRFVDLRGSWDMLAIAGTSRYPQTLEIATENFSTGEITGIDIGAGQTFTVVGTVVGATAKFTTTGGGYTSNAKATVSQAGGSLTMSGTFSDSNQNSGTFTAQRAGP
jgi:hypothetical protein